MNKNYVSVPATQTNYQSRCNDMERWGNVSPQMRGLTLHFLSRHQTDVEGNVTTFPIRVEKPATRASLINGAEQAAYNLITVMDVASFNASLARKAREGEQIMKFKNMMTLYNG